MLCQKAELSLGEDQQPTTKVAQQESEVVSTPSSRNDAQLQTRLLRGQGTVHTRPVQPREKDMEGDKRGAVTLQQAPRNATATCSGDAPTEPGSGTEPVLAAPASRSHRRRQKRRATQTNEEAALCIQTAQRRRRRRVSRTYIALREGCSHNGDRSAGAREHT